MFSCEFCEISKNTFFHRTPLLAASVNGRAWIIGQARFEDYWRQEQSAQT